MLAVLSDAIEHFQKYAFSKDEKRKKAVSRGGRVVSRER